MKHIIFVVYLFLGGVMGYFYWKFYSCDIGCPLKSNKLLMIVYGVLFAWVLALLIKKPEENSEIEENDKEY